MIIVTIYTLNCRFKSDQTKFHVKSNCLQGQYAKNTPPKSSKIFTLPAICTVLKTNLGFLSCIALTNMQLLVRAAPELLIVIRVFNTVSLSGGRNGGLTQFWELFKIIPRAPKISNANNIGIWRHLVPFASKIKCEGF